MVQILTLPFTSLYLVTPVIIMTEHWWKELQVETICLGWQFGGLRSVMAETTEQRLCQWEGISGTFYIFIDEEAEGERAGSWVML